MSDFLSYPLLGTHCKELPRASSFRNQTVGRGDFYLLAAISFILCAAPCVCIPMWFVAQDSVRMFQAAEGPGSLTLWGTPRLRWGEQQR